jgi:hypothetical protein
MDAPLHWYRPEHYPELVSWWKGHKFSPAPPQNVLPPLGLLQPGFAAAWMYLGTPVGWITWPVTNPEAPLRERVAALERVFTTLEQEAQRRGMRWVFTCSGQSGLQGMLKRRGWDTGVRGVNEMFKQL